MNDPLARSDMPDVVSQLTEIEHNTSIYSEQSEYFGKIVAAATFAPPGVEIQTFLKCRKRPERKPCPGEINVCLQENPVQLHWWCSECGDEGIIKNWKGTPGFVTHTQKGISVNAVVCEIPLSSRELSLLQKIEIIEPSAESTVKNSRKIGDDFMISGEVSTFDTIMGYIAFEANHSSKKGRRQTLNQLLNGLKEKLEKAIKHA